MVNTVVEMRNEDPRVVEVYERYFVNMKASFLVVLNRAVDLGEIKEKHRLDEYAEFLIGLIFALAVLYKINSREELRAYIDEKLKVLI